MLNLTKGQVLDLKKADGTPASKIRVGMSWDAQPQNGHEVDADLFVHNKTNGKTAYFGDKTGIKGVTLGADNLTGAGDGDDEVAEFDATVSEDGEMFICVNIYDAVSRGQNFGGVKNLKATVYDSTNNAVLAEYKITDEGGANTGIVIGKIIDSGDTYKFEAIGTYVNGDINQIIASL